MSEYAEREAQDLEPYYIRHVAAMTAEGLHSKAAIAKELAYRDKRIADLERQLAEMRPVVEAALLYAKYNDIDSGRDLMDAVSDYEARKPK